MIQSIFYIAAAAIAVIAMTWYYRRQRRNLAREKSILLMQQEALWDQQKQLRETIQLSARYREEIAEMMRDSGVFSADTDLSDSTSETAVTENDAEEDPAHEDDVYDADAVPDCGNIMIQSVLQHKAWECRREKIALFMDVKELDSVRADDVELVGILFNLFDNAVEACMRIPDPGDRWIRMESKTEKRTWHLRMENACPAEDANERARFTWKPDPENHGIGHTILRDLVRENRGRITTERSGGTYRVDIEMPMKKE